MVFVSNFVKALILPPGCIILGLLFITLFIPRRRRMVLVLMTAFLYFLSIQPTADLLLRPLENAHPPLFPAALLQNPEALAGLQAIVVLGGGTIQNSPEAREGQDTLGSSAMKRAAYAFGLRDYFDVPFVFSGGKVFDYNQESEAATAGLFFISLGLPPQRLILEVNSRNTWENARETANLGIEKAILVTSAFHMPRSVFSFERNGISVIPAPTDYICARGRSYDIFSFLPSMGSLAKVHLALHEYIGLLSYRLFYRE